jgi:hypothetical protein
VISESDVTSEYAAISKSSMARPSLKLQDSMAYPKP